VRGREISTLLSPIESANINLKTKAPNRVGVFLLSPEDGNIYFPNPYVFYYVEF
jgi:hypothetical protein